MAPVEQAGTLAVHQPAQGEPGYAEKAKRFDALAKAVQSLDEEKTRDPAAYAIKYSPAVRDAYARLQSAAISNRTAAASSARPRVDLVDGRAVLAYSGAAG
jgi:hypothetical protein